MKLEKILSILTILAFIILAAIFLHRTNQYLGTAPIATDDDSIANVAVNLWKGEHYGFPASPSFVHFGVQSAPLLKHKHIDATYGYYNYGWFYFVTSGFLNWVFGDDSIHFFRMMNPWGLLLIIGLGIWFFRQSSLLPGILLSAGLIARFFMGVNPVMSRPDIAVSVAAVFFYISAFFAVERASILWWFIAGFWAATAATSHLVAWMIVLAAGLTWLLFALARPEGKKITLSSFCAISAGGIAGVLVYLAMMGFRVKELWTLVTLLNDTVQQEPFLTKFLSSFRMAWVAAFGSFVLGWGGQLLAFLLLGLSFRLPKQQRLKILALVAAPSLTTVLYLVSLGSYRSLVHPAYGILSYVTAMWAMAAAVAALLWLLPFYKKITNEKVKVWGNALALVLVIFSIGAALRNTPNLERLSYGWVKYADYEKQVLDSLPQQAYAWGTLHMGITSGLRTQLVNSNSALGLAIPYNEEGWKKIAPDYLVLGYFTLESYLRNGPLVGKDSPIALLRRKLPNTHYQLARIVFAPPYGNTFIYKKSTSEIPLTVAVNDGTNPQWYTALEKAEKPKVERISPVTIDTREQNGKMAKAQSSVRINLSRGYYLISARVEATNPEQTGAVIATSGSYDYVSGDKRLHHAPLFRGDRAGVFIAEHLGGPLYISYFPGRAASRVTKPLEILSITKIYGTEGLHPVEAISLPPFKEWAIREKPDAAKELATSPWISVNPYSAYTLEIPADMSAGGLRVGIYNRKGKSLLFGETRLLPDRIGFTTADANAVKIVLFQANPLGEPVRFSLGAAKLIPHRTEVNRIKDLLSCPVTGKYVDGSEICKPVDDKELQLLDADLSAIKK